jgi:hypothetical protein
MTVSSPVSKVVHVTNDALAGYTFPFKVFKAGELAVDLVDASFRVIPLELGADYTVDGLGRDQGGAITLTGRGRGKAGTGQSLVMLRRMDFTQETDYRPHDVFPAETHERALDILTMICQELREMMSRAIIAPPNADKPISYADLAALYEATLAAMNETLAALQEMTDSGFILRPATAERLGGVIIGDGLGIDADGRASVDFSKMPTDKFEALLASLRVLIWLTANTTWYVDAVNGSDDYTVETIGAKARTQDTAFKTLQAALDFVCANFHFGPYNAEIRIVSTADMTANEYIVVPKYTASTGVLVLNGQSKATRLVAFVRVLNAVGTVHFRNLKFVMPGTNDNSGINRLLLPGGGNAVWVENCDFDTSNANASQNVLFVAGGAGTAVHLHALSLTDAPMKITGKFNSVFSIGAGECNLRANIDCAVTPINSSARFVRVSGGACWTRLSLQAAPGTAMSVITGNSPGTFGKVSATTNGVFDSRGGGGDAIIPFGQSVPPASGGQIV